MNRTLRAFYEAQATGKAVLPQGFSMESPDKFIKKINLGYSKVTGNLNSPVYRDFSRFIALNKSPLDSDHDFKMIIRKGSAVHAIVLGRVNHEQSELSDLLIFPLSEPVNPLVIHWAKLWLHNCGLFRVVKYVRTFDNPNHGKRNFVDEHLGTVHHGWQIKRNPITGESIFASCQCHFLTAHESNLPK